MKTFRKAFIYSKHFLVMLTKSHLKSVDSTHTSLVLGILLGLLDGIGRQIL